MAPAEIPYFKLNNGVLMPSVGMGMFALQSSSSSGLRVTSAHENMA